MDNLSLETWLSDLETVVDAAKVDRFDLLGVSQGGALAVAYAARHPERVRRMVLYGAYARGRSKRSGPEREEAEMLVSLVKVGWGLANPAFRHAFAQLLVPEGTREQTDPIVELQRVTSSPEAATRIRLARYAIDVTDLAEKVAAPTLVLHAREDSMVPFEEGRLLASLIPNARLVPLEGRNHLPLADDPAWPACLAEVRSFLGHQQTAPESETVALTDREADVMRLVADGLDNVAIGRRLFISCGPSNATCQMCTQSSAYRGSRPGQLRPLVSLGFPPPTPIRTKGLRVGRQWLPATTP